MGVNIEKMRKDRERRDGGPTWKPQEGESIFYLCALHEGEEESNYVETGFHWNVGRTKATIACLNPKRNPALSDERVVEWLKKMGKDVSGGCPVCEYIQEQDLWQNDEDQARSISFNPRFYWLVIPVKHRKNVQDDWVEVSKLRVKPWCSGAGQWERISDFFFSEGDITDVNNAVFISMNRKGSRVNTKYELSLDTETLRSAASLPKTVKAEIKKALASEDFDLYKMAASDFVSRNEVKALLKGIEVEKEEAAEEATKEDSVKECFGDEDLYDEGDSECKECEFFSKCGIAVRGEAEEAQEEETTEEEPSKKLSKAEQAAAKKAKKNGNGDNKTKVKKENEPPAISMDENMQRLNRIINQKSKVQ